MNSFTKDEKLLAKRVSESLDKLLTVIIAGGVGHQYDRDSAKLMVELLRKVYNE